MNCTDTSSTIDTEHSVWSPYSSLSSSATPRPRNRTQNSSTLGNAFKWLGDKSMDTFHGAVITKRANAHVARVKEWQKRTQPRLGPEERDKVSEMLGDALEMARCLRNKRFTTHDSRLTWISCFLFFFLFFVADNVIPRALTSFPTPSAARSSNGFILTPTYLRHQKFLFSSYRSKYASSPCTCTPHSHSNLHFSPDIYPSPPRSVLTRISDSDPLAANLAHDLISALTRTPFTLFTTLHDPEKAVTTIRLVSRELAYGKCTAQHGWLGVDLLRIVEMVMSLRKLTDGEQIAIRDLAVRRRQ